MDNVPDVTLGAQQAREVLGRLVREVWIEWAQQQPAPKPSWLVPWEGLSEPDREVDRRIGEVVASHASAYAEDALARQWFSVWAREVRQRCAQNTGAGFRLPPHAQQTQTL